MRRNEARQHLRALLWLLVSISASCFKMNPRSNVLTLIHRPIEIGDREQKFKYELTEMGHMPDFTFVGWLKFDDIRAHPKYSTSLIRVVNEPSIYTNHKHANSNEVLNIHLLRKGKSEPHNLKFKFPFNLNLPQKSKQYYQERVELAPVEGTWMFLAISMDFNKGSVRVLAKHLLKEAKLVSWQKEFTVMCAEYSLSPNFTTKIGNSGTSNTGMHFGTLLQLNLYPFSVTRLELLSLYSIASSNLILNNKLSDFVFSSRKEDLSFSAMGVSSHKVKPIGELEQRVGGMCFTKNSGIALGRIPFYSTHTFISSPTVFIKFKLLQKIKEKFALINGSDRTQKSMSIEILPGDELRFHIRAVYQHASKLHEAVLLNACAAFETCQAFVTFVTYPNKTSKIMIYVSAQSFFISEFSASGIDFSGFRFTLLNPRKLLTENLKAQGLLRFSSFKSALSMTNSTQKTSEWFFDQSTSAESSSLAEPKLIQPIQDPSKALTIVSRIVFMENASVSVAMSSKTSSSSHCQIPLTSRENEYSCLSCQDAVLFPEDNKCIEFCPLGFRSMDGVCVACRKENCLEIDPTHTIITRVSNSKFRVAFSRKISKINEHQLKSSFIPKITGYTGTSTVQFNCTAVDDRSVECEIRAGHTLYNFNFTAIFNHTAFEALYDESRNLIHFLDATIHVPSLWASSTAESRLAKIVSYACTLIYLATLFFLCLHAFRSWWIQTNPEVARSLIKNLQLFQIIAFMIFLAIPMPASLHEFCWNLFQGSLGLIGRVESTDITQTSAMIFPNFPNYLPKSLFLQCFTILNCVHWLVIGVAVVSHCMTQVQEKLSSKYKDLVRMTHENTRLSNLTRLFMTFDVQGLFFATYEIRGIFASAEGFRLTFGLVAAMAYLMVYFALIFHSVGSLLQRLRHSRGNRQSLENRLTNGSNIGLMQGREISQGEIGFTIVRMSFVASLIFFGFDSNVQVLTIVSTFAAYAICSIIFSRDDESQECISDTFMSGLFFVAIMLVSCLQLSQGRENSLWRSRETLGWLITISSAMVILLNFIRSMIGTQNPENFPLPSKIPTILPAKKSAVLPTHDLPITTEQLVMGETRNKTETEIEESEFKRKTLFGNLGNLGKEASRFSLRSTPKFDEEFVQLSKTQEEIKIDNKKKSLKGILRADVSIESQIEEIDADDSKYILDKTLAIEERPARESEPLIINEQYNRDSVGQPECEVAETKEIHHIEALESPFNEAEIDPRGIENTRGDQDKV